MAPHWSRLLGLWALAAYYWIAWKRAGRDPDAGTMVPLFSPPENMSPAAVRYMMKRKVDPRTMSSTLVSLGVHGQIRIDKEKGGFFSSDTTTVSRTPTASDGPLSDEEQGFLTTLIPYPSGSIEIDNENHTTFEAAKKSLDDGSDGAVRRQIVLPQLGVDLRRGGALPRRHHGDRRSRELGCRRIGAVRIAD